MLWDIPLFLQDPREVSPPLGSLPRLARMAHSAQSSPYPTLPCGGVVTLGLGPGLRCAACTCICLPPLCPHARTHVCTPCLGQRLQTCNLLDARAPRAVH